MTRPPRIVVDVERIVIEGIHLDASGLDAARAAIADGLTAWLADLERNALHRLAGKPLLLAWGMKDPVFGRHGFLERWEASFPRPAVLRLPLADHFIQEDAPQEIADAIAAKFGDAAPGGAG